MESFQRADEQAEGIGNKVCSDFFHSFFTFDTFHTDKCDFPPLFLALHHSPLPHIVSCVFFHSCVH